MAKKSSFHSTDSRPDVEVHLPDSRVIAGPRGEEVGKFLQLVAESLDAPLVAAIVNGDLRELTFPIDMDARVSPVTMGEADGARS